MAYFSRIVSLAGMFCVSWQGQLQAQAPLTEAVERPPEWSAQDTHATTETTGAVPFFGVEAAGWMPVSQPQFSLFGPGAAGSLSGLVSLNGWLMPVIRLRVGMFADGGAPQDPGRSDPGIGTLSTLTLGLRLRPVGFGSDRAPRGDSFFVEVNAGGALSGAFIRPSFEAALGYLFDLGSVDLGPVARFTHVLHFDDPLDSSSAMVASLGLELLFGERHEPIPEVVPPPEPVDTDSDGIIDPDDECITVPEDIDSFEDSDGCPEEDNDADGILDPADRCPLVAEDIDQFEDTDGCPDPDNDQDRILDPNDRCPMEPETVNGVDDADGCPDEGLIVMQNDRIVLEETVLFDLNRWRVKSGARPILQAIVTLFEQHPEWTLVRIEGHADARGSAEWNQTLSENRAQGVRESLVELGIPEARIEARGYGATQLRDERETDEAHQRNRRVEFVVITRTLPAETSQ